MNLSISWKNITILDMIYLLSNNDGYIDGDEKTIHIDLKTKGGKGW